MSSALVEFVSDDSAWCQVIIFFRLSVFQRLVHTSDKTAVPCASNLGLPTFLDDRR